MSDSKISFSLALLIHLLLLFVFMGMKFTLKPDIEYENIEIMPIDDLVVPQPTEEKATAQDQGSQPSAGKNTASTIKISLPSTSENSDETIRMNQLPVKRDKSVVSSYDKTVIDDSWGKSTTMRETPSTNIKDNSTSPLAGNSINNSSSGEQSGHSTDGQSSFEIQGDAVNRKVMKKQLPAYPTDMVKNGTVMLKFSVMPNGTVSEISIVKKSDPVFENLSINALSQWRFNISDKKNTGIITFHFKMD